MTATDLLQQIKRCVIQPMLMTLLSFSALITESHASPVLVAVNQGQQDLRLSIDNNQPGGPQLATNALGRGGQEWLLLTTVEQLQQLLTIDGNPIALGDRLVSSQPLQAQSSELVQKLALLTKAAALWAQDDNQAKQQALAAWQQLAESELPQAFRHIADYGMVNAIAASVFLFDFNTAMPLIQQWYQQHDAQHPYHYKVLWMEGIALWQQGQADEAKLSLSKALDKIKQDPRRALESGELRSQLAIVHLLQRQIAPAETLLNQAMATPNADDYLLASVHDNMGFLYVQKGKTASQPQRDGLFRTAIEHELTAIELIKGLGISKELATMQSNTASIFERLGDIARAQHYYQVALDNSLQSGNNLNAAVVSRNLGKISQNLGDYDKSIVLYRNAIKYFSNASPREAARLTCELGTSQRKAGQLEQALASHQQCADYFDQEQGSDNLSIAHTQLGLDQLQSGNVSNARWHAERSTPLSDNPDNLDASIQQWLLKARLAARQQDFVTFKHCIDQATGLAAGARYPTNLAEIYQTATVASRMAGNPQLTLQYAQAGIEVARYMHQYLDPLHFGPAWSEKTRDMFEIRLALLLENLNQANTKQGLAQSLTLLEQYRAISLTHNIPGHDADSRSMTSLDLDALSAMTDSQAVQSTNWQQTLALSQQQLLATSFNQSSQDKSPPPSLQQVQQHLGHGQRIGYFAETDTDFYVLTISATSAHWRHVGAKADWHKVIVDARNALFSPNNPLPESMDRLRRALLPDPTTVASNRNQWLLLPSASLSGFPFAALASPPSKAAMFTYLPSLRALLAKNHMPDGPKLVRVIADPLFAGQAENNWSSALSPLPFSQQEAEKVRQGLASYQVELITGPQANRESLFNPATRNAHVLHLATHGYYDPQQALHPGLALSPSNGQESTGSGFVTLSELHHYRFNNHLVVISGCETNMGKIAGGEGSLSLGRAFLAQGADNVISTLWPVSDRASVFFMQYFYQYLNDHNDIPRALQFAQTTLASKPRFRHPFYWAAYTHYTN